VLLRARGERPLPSWVVEGLAEFWSQAVIRTHEVELGNPDNSHLRFLQNEPMMPLDELLRIYGYRHDTERRALRTLYAQSWALTHWILLGDGTGTGQAKLDRYLELLAGGSDSVEAFVDLFGPLEEVESNLKRYARQSMFPAMRIPAPEQSDEPFEIRPLSASESAGHKADFLIAMGQNEAARRVLERGAAPEGSERLGVLAFESSEYDEATRWFDDAVRNGTATFLSYYYRALLANERGDHAMAVAELERSIELESRFTPALLELASHYARDPERRERASELLERAVELTPADRLALAELGRKLLEFGRPEEARKVLERMLALPPVPGSKAIARALEAAIERFEAR
jgi:tetratricopeptide (TPR) repeat protein